MPSISRRLPQGIATCLIHPQLRAQATDSKTFSTNPQAYFAFQLVHRQTCVSSNLPIYFSFFWRKIFITACVFCASENLQLSLDTCTFECFVRTCSFFDATINCKRLIQNWAIPVFMVTFSLPHKIAAMSRKEVLNLLCIVCHYAACSSLSVRSSSNCKFITPL